MSRELPSKLNLGFTIENMESASGGAPNTARLTVSIDHVAVPIKDPMVNLGRNDRLGKTCSPIDYTTNKGIYKIKDQTYLGTVDSLISDARVDIYYITNTHDAKEVSGETVTETTTDERFLLFIPSLLFLGNTHNIDGKDSITIPGVIAGVRTSIDSLRVTMSGLDGVKLSTYLPDLTVVPPASITTNVLALDGINDDSFFDTIEIYADNNAGQLNGSVCPPTQLVNLGPINTLFSLNAGENVEMEIFDIRPTRLSSYIFKKTISKVTSGNLVIPLNF